jgi:D-alanyl-D-alanine carboxypeptidase
MKKKQYNIAAIILVLIVVGLILVMFTNHKNTVSTTAVSKPASTPLTTSKQTNSFDKGQYSLKDPTSIWVVVNKQHPLQPKEYVPTDLVIPAVPLRVPGNESMQVRKATATAIESMFSAAKQDGINLMISSGYRSYAYQVGLYGSYVKSSGQAGADTYSARPGFSEHQSGLAADIEPISHKCEVDVCFKDTPEGIWIAANSYKYGFIIRYTSDKAAVTGYEFEPWHVRYVGIPLATEMHRQGIETLEDFFNVSGGSNYTN